MKPNALSFIGLSLAAVAAAAPACSGTASNPNQGGSSGSSASGSQNGGSGSQGSGAQGGSGVNAGSGESVSGASAGSASGSEGSGAASGDNGGSGASAGAASGASASSGAASGASSGAAGSGAVAGDAGMGNFVPAGYAGTPFNAATPLTIPGMIYAADYDSGGNGVAYCHVGAANPVNAQNCGGPKLNDWCCGNNKGCDERTQPTVCPVYRQDADNAGLSHMNLGEPDKYAADSNTWAPGAEGPTLTGAAITAGTAVPMHANMTTEEDTYISYMYTGQWSKYTVTVMEPGTYSIGGLMGVPAGTVITLDFGIDGTGQDITSGMITLPTSPCTWTGCPETYHSWNIVSNVGTVKFNQAGTYVMTFTLVAQQFNPLFFTFTKM